MNIYAIRDRLIGYYQQPFAGDNDQAVLAAVARLVNTGEITSDIAQAPHHFEVWRLAKVGDDGHIEPNREFLQDCSALVRGGIRQRHDAGALPPHATARQSEREPPGAEISTRADPRPVPGTPEGS